MNALIFGDPSNPFKVMISRGEGKYPYECVVMELGGESIVMDKRNALKLANNIITELNGD